MNTEVIEKKSKQEVKKVEKYSDYEYDSELLRTIEKGEKPWFLTSAEVYRMVKSAVSMIGFSEVLVHRLLNGLTVLTKFINDNTRVQIVLDADQSYELINSLDVLLTEQMIGMDDGFDELRRKLCSTIRVLMVALVHHKEWTENYLLETKGTAVTAVQTRYETVLSFLKLLVAKAEERIFPKMLMTSSSSSPSSEETSSSNVRLGFGWNLYGAYLQTLLLTAQPYVHSAVTYSLPYVEKAKEISHPYYDKAIAPYVVPVVTKADSRMKGNKFIGKYYSEAKDTSTVILNEVKSYALPVGHDE
jgi:hypothetical protein